MAKETTNVGGFMKIYKQLFKITTKLREQLQFRNIDQANFNHLRIINDKSQSNSETEANFSKSFKKYQTIVKKVTFFKKLCNNFGLFTHKFFGKN